jgi:hypothetical protein
MWIQGPKGGEKIGNRQFFDQLVFWWGVGGAHEAFFLVLVKQFFAGLDPDPHRRRICTIRIRQKLCFCSLFSVFCPLLFMGLIFSV